MSVKRNIAAVSALSLIGALSLNAVSSLISNENTANAAAKSGDINYDGKIDCFDIVLARKGIIGSIDNKKTLKAADADSNGVFELNDVLLITQFVMGKISEFPVVEPEIVPGQVKYTTECP